MASSETSAWGNPSLNFQQRRVVSAYEGWLADLFPGPTAFVTFTMKQGLKLGDGTWARLTREIAVRQLAWFLRELDREVLGTAATRYGKKLGRAVFLEGGTLEKRLHAHLVLEIPPPSRMNSDDYFGVVDGMWAEAEWGREEGAADPCYYTPGAIGYSLKEGSDALQTCLCEPPYFGAQVRKSEWLKYSGQGESSGRLLAAG